MSEAKLIFNGVQPDGSPGLAPMTAEELAEHIQKSDKPKYERDKELKNLKQKSANALKLVEALVESQEQYFRGELAAREDWLMYIARNLLETVFGSTVPIEGMVQELATMLQMDTFEQLRKIINGTFGWELLLGQRSDETNLESSLKDKTKHLVSDLSKTLLSDERAIVLSQSLDARRLWHKQFSRQLVLLPVEALKTLPQKQRIVIKLRDILLQKLQLLSAAQNSGLQKLTQRLTELATERQLEWTTLARTLDEALDAAIEASKSNAPEDAVDWPALTQALREWLAQLPKEMGWEDMGAASWIDARNLQQTGWGIIFPQYMASERVAKIQEALTPLFCHRLIQVDLAHLGLHQEDLYTKSLDDLLALRDAKVHPKWQELFQICADIKGYRPNDTARVFLNREGRNADPSKPVDPSAGKVPYYLLLVGSPEEIPFEFQYGLDVQFAVGRIDFGDDYAAYRRYAENVVAAERGLPTPSNTVTFFAVHNDGDVATELGRDYLAAPLQHNLDTHKDRYTAPWNFQLLQGDEAKKARLLSLLSGAERPALLFTTSHGLEFDYQNPAHRARQEPEQGALVCSDWPESGTTAVKPEHYLCGRDVRDNDALDARGMIAFFFACYGAGTPRYDEYTKQDYRTKGKLIAQHAFIADLPKALLSLERGALAVVGHVERAWGTSFLGEVSADPQALKTRSRAHVAVFESALDQLLKGYPLGDAMDFFNIRYAALSTEITSLMESDRLDEHKLAELWTTTNDARGYIIIGDPAVRLALP